MRALTLGGASAGAVRDALSLREFLGLAPGESVPAHSSLCRIRGACRWRYTTNCLSLCCTFWKKPVCCMAKIRERRLCHGGERGHEEHCEMEQIRAQWPLCIPSENQQPPFNGLLYVVPLVATRSEASARMWRVNQTFVSSARWQPRDKNNKGRTRRPALCTSFVRQDQLTSSRTESRSGRLGDCRPGSVPAPRCLRGYSHSSGSARPRSCPS